MKNSNPPDNVIPLVIKRRRGRPRVVRPRPDHDEQAHVEWVAKLGRVFIEADPIVRSTSEGEHRPDDDLAVLDHLVVEMAKETAALGYEANRLRAEGRVGAEAASVRRIDGLVALARVIALRERRRQEVGFMDEATVMKLVGMLMAEAEAAVSESASPEVAQAFLAKLKQKMSASGLGSGTQRDETPGCSSR